jgi:dolichol-phosphate mannosyltransferase
VPYVRPQRLFGRTTNSFLKNIGWARKAIFSFSYAPLDFITLLAFVMVLLSLLGILVQILLRIFIPELAPRGFTTLITLILFMGGIQLLCLSIIGSYLSHIYDEVKKRPPYIVESMLNMPAQRSKPFGEDRNAVS